MILVTRVYNHGDSIERECRDYNTAIREFNFMVANRNNCAIFINGRCVHYGILGEEKCKELEQSMK